MLTSQLWVDLSKYIRIIELLKTILQVVCEFARPTGEKWVSILNSAHKNKVWQIHENHFPFQIIVTNAIALQ